MLTETRSAIATAQRTDDGPVIEIKNLFLAFDEKVILRDVSFTLDAGHTTIILGASGSIN